MTEKKLVQSSDVADVLGLAQADLTERVAEAMQSVSRAYVGAVVDALAQKGYVGLTPASVSLLAYLTPEGCQTVDLAHRTRRSKQATGKIVSELERHDYAERLPDPNDGRAQLVRPTAKGLEALALGTTIKQDLAMRSSSVIGSETMERLHRDLARLEDVFRAKPHS